MNFRGGGYGYGGYGGGFRPSGGFGPYGWRGRGGYGGGGPTWGQQQQMMMGYDEQGFGGEEEGFGNVPPPQSYGNPFRGGGGAARGRGGGGNAGGAGNAAAASGGNQQPPFMTPGDVLSWLDHAPPFALRRILTHVRWLLQQHGEPEQEPVPASGEGGDEGDEEEEEGGNNGEGAPEMLLPPDEMGMFAAEANTVPANKGTLPPPLPVPAPVPPPAKKAKKHSGLGFGGGAGQQWTPQGWAAKDNSHKVTTTMRVLPQPDILPPTSAQHPEAGADRDKLKILKNNLSMMQFEMNKICRRYRINQFDIAKLETYEAAHQDKLRTAHTCVSAAEKTLNEFKEFLVEEKYKEWNEEQKRRYDEQMKSMIGEMPTGNPFKRPLSGETTTPSAAATAALLSPLAAFKKGADLKIDAAEASADEKAEMEKKAKEKEEEKKEDEPKK